MYKILHLPTAEYVVDGYSRKNDPQDLYFDTLQDAEDRMSEYYFKVCCIKSKDIFYSSPYISPSATVIPKYLFEIVEVPDV
jgi:hypothetical protein